jgi:hypothetical protein
MVLNGITVHIMRKRTIARGRNSGSVGLPNK